MRNRKMTIPENSIRKCYLKHLFLNLLAFMVCFFWILAILAICSLVVFFIVAFVLCIFQWPRNCAVSVTLVRLFSSLLNLTSVWDTNNGSGKVDSSNATFSDGKRIYL